MEPLMPPEGDVVTEHRATYTARVMAALFLIAPGLVLAAVSTQATGPDADVRGPLMATAAVLAGLGVLAFAQQIKTRAVLRADGVERWGMRGRLWALRWAEMIELRYKVVKIRVYHVIPAGTYIYLTFTDPEGRKRKLPANLKGMDTLAERIAEQQTTARFAEARTKIDQGEPVASARRSSSTGKNFPRASSSAGPRPVRCRKSRRSSSTTASCASGRRERCLPSPA